ncbi:helix-turn-helix domain-containing protein, partial [Acidithiobacillus ferrooxidans]|nr:helix-turn-helix domain-containing protein [Acidithiobacillus ferrooxidans]
GTTPIAVAQAQRVLLAKKMIVETTLSMTDVAIAAGFGSVRRFNDAIQRNYGRAPKTMRHTSTSNGNMTAGITLKLPFTPPYDWEAMIDFLAGRAIPGVEAVDAGKYARSFQWDGMHGVVEVQQESETNHLLATIYATEVPPIGMIVARLRRLFDLDANIGMIDAHLSADPRLAARVRERPGLRVPGSWDLFELTVRAVLGQQISVAAATTLSGRLVATLGEP